MYKRGVAPRILISTRSGASHQSPVCYLKERACVTLSITDCMYNKADLYSLENNLFVLEIENPILLSPFLQPRQNIPPLP